MTRQKRRPLKVNGTQARVDGVKTDHRLPLGNFGEREAARRLAARGHKILFFKPDLSGTNYRGFDIVTYKNGYVYFIDNKAYLRQGTVYSASALTRNFQANLDGFVASLRKMLVDLGRTEGDRSLIRNALDAIAARRIVKVVTNATLASKGSPLKNLSPGLRRQGLRLWNILKW